MAKAMHGSAQMAVAFIGSLLYVATVAALWASGALVGFSSNFWIGAVTAVGVISTIVLFLASIGGMMGGGSMPAEGARKAAVIGGFALVGLSFGSSLWVAVSLIGFILASYGSSMALMKAK